MKQKWRSIAPAAALIAGLAVLFAGLAVFFAAPQLAATRFTLWDRAVGLFQSADYPPAEISRVSLTVEELLADPRVTADQSMMLVRPGLSLPEEFEPAVAEYRDSGVLMNEALFDPYASLAREVNDRFANKLYISSSFRTREKQQELTQSQGEFAAGVDESEHQTGLALDVYISQYAGKSFLRCAAGRWVNRNCWQYGFIIRYPYYGEEETGLPYEPWHLRYVGQPHAELIMKNRLTLERYLDSLEPGVFYRYGDAVIARQEGDRVEVPSDFQRATVSPDNRGGWVTAFWLE